MDTQVKYILLLLVVTVVCIGISAGVKYDKSSIKTHPDMPHAHIPDDNHSGLSQENQNKVKILQEQIEKSNMLIEMGIKEVMSLETKLNNTVPILNSSGNIDYETGEPTLADINKLFISESINDASDTLQYMTVYTNSGSTGISYNSTGVLLKILLSSNGKYSIETINKMYIHFVLIGSVVWLSVNQLRTAAQFDFDTNGFLRSSGSYITLDNPAVRDVGYTLKSSLKDAYGKYVLKLINSTTAGQFNLVAIKLLTTPKQTQLYNLEYFGLTTDINYRVPFHPPIYININDPFSLNTIPQTSIGFVPNGFGMFASVFPNAAGDETAAQTGPAAGFTSYNGTNLSGFTSSIFRFRYAISVLNPGILNSGSIPKDFKMNIPANITSYTIPANGEFFYSINLLFLDNPTTDISNVTFVDQNNIKGVQNVLFIITKNTEDPNYSMLERNVIGQDLSTPLTINAAITTKQLYNLFSNQRIILGVFFNPCLEENSGTNETMTGNEKNSYSLAITQHINYFFHKVYLSQPRTHRYFQNKYYPYYFDTKNNLWKSP